MPDTPGNLDGTKVLYIHIPAALHRDLKVAAAQQGRPLRAVIPEALELWLRSSR